MKINRAALINSSIITLLALLALALLKLETPAQNPASQNHSYASSRPMPEPVLFGEGVISTTDDDLNAAFTPDGQTVYFSRNVPVNRMGVILFSHFKNGKWSTPEVAPFSGQYSDYDPFFSKDGAKLFYISNRPVEAGKPKRDYDIWVVEKTANGWGEPRNPGAPINTDKDEFYPSLAADGTMVFSANRAGSKGGFDLYKTKLVDGKYTEPENMGEAINSQFAEIDSYIAPDQSFIVFASYGRPDELGRGDLYISYNRNGAWTPAKNLGNKINSSAREYCPIGSPDGKYFFFTSFRGFADNPPAKPFTYQELTHHLKSARNGLGNIYQVDISALQVSETASK